MCFGFHLYMRAYKQNQSIKTYIKLEIFWSSKRGIQSSHRWHQTSNRIGNHVHHSGHIYDSSLNRTFQHCIRTFSDKKACSCGFFVCSPSLCPALNAGNWNNDIDPSNDLAPYQGATDESIRAMIDSCGISIGKNHRILDLGAGDGRIMINALFSGAIYAEGWELNHNVYELASFQLSTLFPRGSNISYKLFHGDARLSSPLDFSVVTMFLLPSGLNILFPWLKEVTKSLSLLSVDEFSLCQNDVTLIKFACFGWPLPEWNPSFSCVVGSGGSKLYLYVFKKA